MDAGKLGKPNGGSFVVSNLRSRGCIAAIAHVSRYNRATADADSVVV
jgi:hypothetical protein